MQKSSHGSAHCRCRNCGHYRCRRMPHQEFNPGQSFHRQGSCPLGHRQAHPLPGVYRVRLCACASCQRLAVGGEGGGGAHTPGPSRATAYARRLLPGGNLNYRHLNWGSGGCRWGWGTCGYPKNCQQLCEKTQRPRDATKGGTFILPVWDPGPRLGKPH